MVVTEKHDGGRAVVFDEPTGRLLMGDRSRQLPEHPSNRTVLERYVDLVGESRGQRMIDTLHLRDDDVVALSRALELDGDRLVAEIEAVLGATPDEAQSLLARLRTHRLAIGVAVVAVGVAATGGALTASMGRSDPPPASAPVAAVAAPTEAATVIGLQVEPPLVDGEVFDLFSVELTPAVSIAATDADAAATPGAADTDGSDGELTVTDDGVGLIPPASIANTAD